MTADFLPDRPGAGDRPRRAFVGGRTIARALTIADLRAIALRRLPRVSAEYLEGGAEEEITLAGNRRAFDARTFRPRVLVDVSRVDLARDLLGDRSALPFAIAPTGFNGLLWPRGDVALARAAAAAGIPCGQSTVSNASIADVAGAAAGLRHWFQLYVLGEDAVWRGLVAEAEARGSRALLVTVDTATHGNREWDKRNYLGGFTPTLAARIEMLRHPGWLRSILLKEGWPRFVNLEPFVPGPKRDLYTVAAWSLANMRPATDWRTIEAIRAAWPRKLVVKGVQHPDDVRRARDAGADGVVLSNHGGRQLDRAAAPIRLVAEARALVGPDFSILVDSGFRRGTEIVQALALGADGVLLGRAMLYGLAAGGEAGVARAIAILAEEVRRTMALLGLTALDQLSPSVFAP
ncbi:MAG: alpha-hydroxy acid oxidase [Rhodospirillales bacterium]